MWALAHTVLVLVGARLGRVRTVVGAARGKRCDICKRDLPKAYRDVYQQPIAGMSPESSWPRVWDVEGVTSLAVLTDGSSFGVKEDALFLRCFFTVRSVHHHKTTVMQSVQCRAEVESMTGDFAETKRFLTTDRELTADLAESYGSMSLTWEERWKSVVFTGRHGALDPGNSSAADPGACGCWARCSLRQGHLHDRCDG